MTIPATSLSITCGQERRSKLKSSNSSKGRSSVPFRYASSPAKSKFLLIPHVDGDTVRLQVLVDVPCRRKHHRDLDGPVALREIVANRLKVDNLRSIPAIRLKPAAEGTQKT